MLRLLHVVVQLTVVTAVGCVLMAHPACAQRDISPEDIEIVVPPTIRTIEFKGNTVISSQELRNIAGIRSGQLLTEQVLRNAVANIRSAYADRGYLVAITEIRFPQPGEVGTLKFELQEVRIAEVRITGLQKVREDIIRGILITQPGDLFNRRNVQRDVSRLQELGVFESIEPELQFTSPGEAVIVWNLVEREKLNYISAGGSIGQPEGLVGSFGLILANIRGRADTLRIEGYIQTVQVNFGGRVSYHNPLIAPNRTSLLLEGFSILLYRFGSGLVEVPGEDFNRYFERRTGAEALLSRVQKADLTLSTGLRYEDIDTSNLPARFLTGAGDSLDSAVALGVFQSALDRRNSIDYPSAGSYTVGRLDTGAADLKGDGTGGIAKALLDRRWYKPLRQPERSPEGTAIERVPVLAFRAVGGTSVGNLPFSEQFFLGGLSLLPLRGYKNDRFWGKNLVLGSMEYRYPIRRRLVALAFVDAGDAWASDFQFIEDPSFTTEFRQHRDFSPKAGVGVGVRYISPIGPLALDFGYGEEFRIYFNIGRFL